MGNEITTKAHAAIIRINKGQERIYLPSIRERPWDVTDTLHQKEARQVLRNTEIVRIAAVTITAAEPGEERECTE